MTAESVIVTVNNLRPMMSEFQILYVEKLLRELADTVEGPLQVFEWGSGGSTYHFATMLANAGIDFNWVSAEYNKRWYEQVTRVVCHMPQVTVKLYPVNNNWLKQRRTKMEAYIAAARACKQKFHFILVDGRKRRRCMLEASKLLEAGGRVALHDASRDYYQCAFSAYTFGDFVDPDLWIGRHD